jgi:hypothetical protein
MVYSGWCVHLVWPSAFQTLIQQLESVTATYTVWSISQLPMTPDIVFLQETRKWAISFYTMALFTNLIATSCDPSRFPSLDRVY